LRARSADISSRPFGELSGKAFGRNHVAASLLDVVARLISRAFSQGP
jgi:hypothetical protein